MDKIKEFGNKLFDFVMKNFDNPMFWVILFVIILIIMYIAIKDFGNK